MIDDLDYYDEKLKNHVFKEQPIYNKEVFDVLKERYPNKEVLKLYRGINFRTQEQYLNFINSIEENKGYKARRADSFSADERTVLDFALTQPTYFLNEELMRAEDERSKNKERLSGYCGVVVEIEVPEGAVVDITESGLGIEMEAIVEPFSVYACKLNVVESYEMKVSSPEFSVNDYVSKNFNNDFSDPFFKYILHHHKSEFNEESKHSVFNTLNEISIKERLSNLDINEKVVHNSNNLIIVEVDEYVNGYRSNKKEKVYTPIFNRMLFQQAYEGYFTGQDYKTVCEKAEEIVKYFTDFHVKNDNIKWKENNELVKVLSRFCSEEIIDYYKRNVLSGKADEYRDIGKDGEKINSLPISERPKAIEDHKNKLVSFLENLVSELPDDEIKNNKKNRNKLK
jgi:hypothetical protein